MPSNAYNGLTCNEYNCEAYALFNITICGHQIIRNIPRVTCHNKTPHVQLFTVHVKAAGLVAMEPPHASTVIVTGWGASEDGGDTSSVLQKLNLEKVRDENIGIPAFDVMFVRAPQGKGICDVRTLIGFDRKVLDVYFKIL